MRLRWVRISVLAIVTICVWAHVSELFDHWDDTLQTGNDIEFNLIVVALCVGTAIAAAGIVCTVLRRLRARMSGFVLHHSIGYLASQIISVPLGLSPPPLRI